MIIFLYGEDTYRSRQKLLEITEHYKKVHKSGLNLRLFDGKNIDYQDFKDEFQQMPMFQEKKLVILSNIFQNNGFTESFLENGKCLADSKDIIVIREEGEIDSKSPFFKFLSENSKIQEFKMLGGSGLNNWAKKEFEKYRVVIQPEALNRLVCYVGNNLWQFSMEAQKLAAFRRDEIIVVGDVDLLVKPEIEMNIFKATEALAMRDKKKAIYLLHERLEKGDKPLYLLSMINSQFRNLLLAKKNGRIAGHPYFARKTLWLAENFTLDKLNEIYRGILEADLKIKTGRIDPQVALDLLIAGV